MSRIGDYDHLNDDTPLKVTINMDDLATKLEQMNYGTHRFLSALVRARRKLISEGSSKCPKLTDGIEKLLNENLF